jgi:hypothetical protein
MGRLLASGLTALLMSTGCDDTIFSASSAESYEPTWEGVEEFFVDHCDSCHPSLQGIDLHSDVENELAGDSAYYVVPGDPDSSRLWTIISDPNDEFLMPFGEAEPLPDTTIDHVREWIENGGEL